MLFIATDNHLSFIRLNLQRFPHYPDDRVVGIGAFIAGFGTWLDRRSHNFVVNLYPLPHRVSGNWAAVAVCFLPEEHCTAFAVDAIDRASSRSAYGLWTSLSTVEALIQARRCGADVRIIADITAPCGHNSGIGPSLVPKFRSG